MIGGGGGGCNKFVPVMGGDGTKIAPTGDIFDQPPGGMVSIRGNLTDHVGDLVVLSPEGAVLVTSSGTESSYPRPPQSLNNSPALTETAPDPSTLAQTSTPALTFHHLNHSNSDAKFLYDYRSSRFSSSPPHYGFRRDFTAKMQAEYRTLDTRRFQLQLFSHTDRTAATQLLVYSMYDVLSGIFNVADTSGSVTVRSPTCILGWHGPLLKLTKASKFPNGDDTHALYPLVDDLFAQLQE